MLNFNLFANAKQADLDNLLGLAGQALDGVEQLCALNLQALKASTAELAQSTEAVLSAKSPAELVQLQTAALQAAPEKALAYIRHAKEIFDGATAGQRTAIDAQVADVQAKFLDAVNGALKNAPGLREHRGAGEVCGRCREQRLRELEQGVQGGAGNR